VGVVVGDGGNGDAGGAVKEGVGLMAATTVGVGN
jgi:hypothetical protein